jgi:hypothetical protein
MPGSKNSRNTTQLCLLTTAVFAEEVLVYFLGSGKGFASRGVGSGWVFVYLSKVVLRNMVVDSVAIRIGGHVRPVSKLGVSLYFLGVLFHSSSAMAGLADGMGTAGGCWSLFAVLALKYCWIGIPLISLPVFVMIARTMEGSVQSGRRCAKSADRLSLTISVALGAGLWLLALPTILCTFQ